MSSAEEYNLTTFFVGLAAHEQRQEGMMAEVLRTDLEQAEAQRAVLNDLDRTGFDEETREHLAIMDRFFTSFPNRSLTELAENVSTFQGFIGSEAESEAQVLMMLAAERMIERTLIVMQMAAERKKTTDGIVDTQASIIMTYEYLTTQERFLWATFAAAILPGQGIDLTDQNEVVAALTLHRVTEDADEARRAARTELRRLMRERAEELFTELGIPDNEDREVVRDDLLLYVRLNIESIQDDEALLGEECLNDEEGVEDRFFDEPDHGDEGLYEEEGFLDEGGDWLQSIRDRSARIGWSDEDFERILAELQKLRDDFYTELPQED